MEVKSFSISRLPKLVFGPGSIKDLPAIAGEYGDRALLVVGGSSLKSSGRYEAIRASLVSSKFSLQEISIPGEPSPDAVDDAIRQLKGKAPHVVIAIGGGSVLDAGKAVSAMLAEEGSVWDYLEGVGTKKPSGKKAPFIAIPTTSGTGSEATKNAVFSVVGPGGFKKSIRHDNYVPDAAIVDPELTVSCPRPITAACGMDALSQLIESYTSTKANPLTDALCLSALAMFKEGFLPAYHNGADLAARTQLAYASCISGVTLSQAGLGTVHGIAGVIGGLFPVPHGVACGTLLEEVMRQIIASLQNEQAPHLKKFADIGRIFDGTAAEPDEYYCQKLISVIHEYGEITGIPGLGAFGIGEKDIPAIVEKADNKTSPVFLNQAEMGEIIRRRIG
jgi:alcohol dehydrogenase